MRQREKRSTAWAVVVSLALHAALFAFLATRPPRPQETAQEPIEVTLISVPPQPEEPKPEEPEPAPEPEPPRPEPKKPPKVVRAEPEPAPEEPKPEPEPVAEAPAAPVDDVPRAQPELPSKPAMVGGLAPSATWALGLDAGVALADRPGLKAPEIPTDLAADAVKKTLGRGRVDRGLVNSYYAKLGKALIKTWDADRAVSQFGLKGYVEQFGENTKIWNNIWKDRAAEFGRTGNPYGDDSTGASDINRRIDARLPGGFDAQSQRAANKKVADAFRSTKRATIRVVQALDGNLIRVELVEPSNDARVDNEALADVRAAAEKLPPPPPEEIEGKEQLSSLWQFELIVSISPPIPTLTFEFDEALGFIDARLPLDRRIYKRVRLVSVE